LEAGPCQGTSGVQRAFGWFRWEFANLASPFQTQLAIDTHMAVGDTQAMVVDIHRKVLAGQEGTSGKNHLVGAIYSSTTECLLSSRLKQGQGC
jgi:hypothetical protein